MGSKKPEVCQGCQVVFGSLSKNYGDDYPLWKEMRRRHGKRTNINVCKRGVERFCHLCIKQREGEQQRWRNVLAIRPFGVPDGQMATG